MRAASQLLNRALVSLFPTFNKEATTLTQHSLTMSLTKLLNQKPTTEPTFTLFPTLPPELRLKIWKYALPGPRVVRLSLMEHSNSSHRRGHEKYAIHATSTIPSIIQTNVEGREAALKVYELAFPTQLLHPVYFDFNQDTIHLDANTLIAFSQKGLPDIVEKLRHLMISKLRVCLLYSQTLSIKPFGNLETVLPQENLLSTHPNFLNLEMVMKRKWEKVYGDKRIPYFRTMGSWAMQLRAGLVSDEE